jgi:hypothetical protein
MPILLWGPTPFLFGHPNPKKEENVAEARMERVTAVIWPEAAGVLLLCAGHVIARGLDAAWALDRPFKRISDWAHVFALGGSAYCIATDRAADTMKAVFYGDMALLGTSFGDWVYKSAVGKKVAAVRARRLAEKGARGGGGGPSGSRQLTPAQEQVLLEAGKILEAQGARRTVGAGSRVDF